MNKLEEAAERQFANRNEEDKALAELKTLYFPVNYTPVFATDVIKNNKAFEDRNIFQKGWDAHKDYISTQQAESDEEIIHTQLCPKCQGDGEVYVNELMSGKTSGIVGHKICDVCNGAKVLSRVIIPDSLEQTVQFVLEYVANQMNKDGGQFVLAMNDEILELLAKEKGI